jgi:prolyl oligopeptidase
LLDVDHGFDNDFGSEYLVTNKYTTRGKIAIHGISNGGLIVCATVSRAPEGLFGAVIAEYGVQDLLKVHVMKSSARITVLTF